MTLKTVNITKAKHSCIIFNFMKVLSSFISTQNVQFLSNLSGTNNYFKQILDAVPPPKKTTNV